ncbi:MAG: voltage-gated potassium channel [Bacteroidia bacterium]|jgi:voltage-gated potassium channel
MLESVSELQGKFGKIFYQLEWVFTILFTSEYLLRIWISEKPKKYIFSFFGLVDLISIIPSYLGLFLIGGHSLLVIRSLRLLRVFRVLKLAHFLGEASQLSEALKASRAKIIVFIGAVIIMVTILGTVMYLVEGGENGFTSIPRSIYWAIVTMTTVGYGDIAPGTITGQAIASFIMILGYGIIAVPTGIVTSEMGKKRNRESMRKCASCQAKSHLPDAKFCYNCGKKVNLSKFP